MVSHPVFGLHSASSGHSEFGGLGTLGTPTALAAHPQLTSFPGKQPLWCWRKGESLRMARQCLFIKLSSRVECARLWGENRLSCIPCSPRELMCVLGCAALTETLTCHRAGESWQESHSFTKGLDGENVLWVYSSNSLQHCVCVFSVCIHFHVSPCVCMCSWYTCGNIFVEGQSLKSCVLLSHSNAYFWHSVSPEPGAHWLRRLASQQAPDFWVCSQACAWFYSFYMGLILVLVLCG